jgi:hypothetical protein
VEREHMKRRRRRYVVAFLFSCFVLLLAVPAWRYVSYFVPSLMYDRIEVGAHKSDVVRWVPVREEKISSQEIPIGLRHWYVDPGGQLFAYTLFREVLFIVEYDDSTSEVVKKYPVFE